MTHAPFRPRVARARGQFGAALALAASLTLSCSNDRPASVGRTPDEVDASPSPADTVTVTFDHDAYTLRAGASRSVAISTDPSGEHTVRLALTGDAHDAFIERARLTTAGDGTATITLTASTETADFALEGWVGDGARTRADIVVQRVGTASLTLFPEYSGLRAISEWVASAHVGETCDGLPLGADGPLTASASADTSPTLAEIPAAPVVAVTVRAGHYVTGCQDVGELRGGDERELIVRVSDVRVPIERLDLHLTLTLAPSPETDVALRGLVGQIVPRLLNGAANDADALLDRMSTLAASAGDRAALSTLRAGTTLLADLQTAIRDRARVALLDGVASFYGQDALRVRLRGEDSSPTGSLDLVSLAGAAPEDTGASPTTSVTLAVDPDDTLRLGATLEWAPARVAAMLAERSLQRTIDSGAATVGEALADAVDCPRVAESLQNATGGAPNIAFGGCDLACAEALCRASSAALWTDAVAASTEVVSLDLTVAGLLTLGDAAEPLGLQGSWLGSSTLAGDQQMKLSGSIGDE